MNLSESLSLFIGAVGAITGLISLAWHVLNSRSKLILQQVYFKKYGFGVTQPRGYKLVGVDVSLRNKSNRSTTIEYLSIKIGHYIKTPLNNQIKIEPNSSEKLRFELDFKDEEFDEIFSEPKQEFEVIVGHTFGDARRKAYDNLNHTGHLHII